MTNSSSPYLGEFPLLTQTFKTLDASLSDFHSPAFLALKTQQKRDRVSTVLYELIKNTPSPCFLLAAVVEYIGKIYEMRIVDSYTFASFELWLNQFSGLSVEENYQIRAKIVGKLIPRSAYQYLFPIGMGKVYPGSHFVTAHGSPDLDTTIASFWGWMDALGARVSEGLHIWNVPGGAPLGQVEVELLFSQVFGKHFFSSISKTRTALALSGIDLVTQKGFVRETQDASILEIDHEGGEKAIVLVDSSGYYVGDWQSVDVEGVRQIISLFNHSLRWFSHTVQMELLQLFAKKELLITDVELFLDRVLLCVLSSSRPVQEFTSKQREMVNDYLKKVLQIEKGLECTFHEFAQVMKKLGFANFEAFIELLTSLKPKLSAFRDDRASLFDYLQQVMYSLDRAIESVRESVEKLGTALKIKTEVFKQKPHYVNYRADVDEIKAKMSQTSSLSVITTDKEGHLTPIGVIHAKDLSQPILGTVTLRDFCNKEETKIPAYLEVISVIDHHKSQLSTTAATTVLISDAQSSNVLCAEMAFAINDQFGTGGMSLKEIETQIELLKNSCSSSQDKRCLARLLQKHCIADSASEFFIDPARERMEYLHFLYGILDDTDLLTKVSDRDLECVVQLLNRLKSLCLKKEVEVISLQDLPKDADFIRKASLRVLQNRDLYSLYQKVYLAKELAVEKSVIESATGESRLFFVDTKEQNGCARVGQAKLFPSNYPIFEKQSSALQARWQENAESFFSDHLEIGLHMQMISTIAGAEQVFAGTEEAYKHQDELWIWIPFTEASIEHLKEFLNAFSSAPQIRQATFSAEFYGERAQDFADIFLESFPLMTSHILDQKKSLSLAVLKYKAGLINSRKAVISPYLPKPLK